MNKLVLILIFVFVACVPEVPSPAPTSTHVARLSPPTPVPTKPPTVLLPTDNPAPAIVLVGAGDIAACQKTGDSETAALINALPEAYVFTAGDNAYEDGTPAQFKDCYDPTWGVFKDRTRPVPGNHDYDNDAEDASGYFDYFGAAAGEPGKGYYSYELGSWHIVAVNSEIDIDKGSSQEQWLRQDLSDSTKPCTLAYWHRPLFSSSSDHGGSPDMKPLFQALFDYHVDLVVNGHDHIYERFAKQNADGMASSNGVREFVVGTGGRSLYEFGSPEPNSEARYAETYGVIEFTLKSNSYDWQFIPVEGSYSDIGSEQCNPK
jgi:hypothetical protein